MIKIRNVSSEIRPSGLHTYTIWINQRFVTKFRHRRELGLAQCLYAAADAVSELDARELLLFIQEFSEER